MAAQAACRCATHGQLHALELRTKRWCDNARATDQRAVEDLETEVYLFRNMMFFARLRWMLTGRFPYARAVVSTGTSATTMASGGVHPYAGVDPTGLL